MIINISVQQLLQELSDLVISCDADNAKDIVRIASLEKATESDIAILLGRGDASVFDSIQTAIIEKSHAGLFLSQTKPVPGKKYLLVKDDLAPFNKLVLLAEKRSLEQQTNGRIDPSAVVDKAAHVGTGSSIGSQTKIYAHVYVGNQCAIGKNVTLMPGVIVLDRCIIGDHSIIHSGTVIGSDGFGYQVSQTGMKKIPQIGIVQTGKYVEIGANCSIDRAAFDITFIGNGVKMDNGCHVAHNVIIGDHTAVLAQTAIAGGAKIGMGCMIGGQVAIKDHVVIGDGVKVVSKSGVLSDVSNGQTVAGIPAVPFSQWKRTVVILGKLPEYIKVMQSFTKKRSLWIRVKALLGVKQ